MSEISITGSRLGNQLQTLLMCDDLQPGDAPSYQTCKTIYAYHPLGAKMAESPIRAAQSQKRLISIPESPEEVVREAFEKEWQGIGADSSIFSLATQARVYGITSLALLVDGEDSDKPIQLATIAGKKISFNVYDPLNTAGSLVLNQNPSAMDFQKHQGISVQGQVYHRSRACTLMNEKPIFLEYSQSAFGYVGRSIYQRALFPLKSFIQTLVTDDMVTRKAGVLIAMMQAAGSIIDNVMQAVGGIKRALLKEAATNNVISIGQNDKVETLNMQNLDGAYGLARTNILKNIATAGDMPAVMLENETLTEGFGEGTEDAKIIARYINGVREWMQPAYDFMTTIVQYRAWTEEFYKTIRVRFPEEYGEMDYQQAFYRWTNSFSATWPSLLEEPESEQIKVEETKYKTVVAVAEVLLPITDPENKARAIQWLQDNLNENKRLFTVPLDLDIQALAAYVPPQPTMGEGDDEKEPAAPPAFSNRA